MRAHSNAFRPKFLEFNSSCVVGQRALYHGNGVGNRSQTWSKVSSKVVLLKYSAIMIFVKIAI